MATRGRGYRRPTLRETLERNNAADRFYAAMAGVEPKAQSIISPKRTRSASVTPSDPNELEDAVKKEVGELLASDSRIYFCVRQNSGAMHVERNGSTFPIWYYRLVRRPEPMTIVDFWGFLHDQRPFAFECKRRSWRVPSGERELKQQAFLRMIECMGGRAGFVRGADEVRGILA